MHKLGRWLGLIAVVILMASATSVAAEEEQSLEKKLADQGFVMEEDVRNIRSWSMSGWTYVDDHHFILRSGVSDNYLISLRTRSLNLRWATRVGFSKTTGSLSNMDRVIVRGRSGQSERIHIDKIYPLKKLQEDEEKEDSGGE